MEKAILHLFICFAPFYTFAHTEAFFFNYTFTIDLIVSSGTESCIRLVDVDGDGVDDVIIGLALGKDVTSMLTEESMGEFCRKNGTRILNS